MAMVKCPYCNNEVDEKYQDKECPFCGKYVKSSDWLKAQVRSYIWKFKKNGVYDQIKALVQTGGVTEATKVIRTVVGRQDTVVEKLVISDMLTTKNEKQYEAGDSEVEESADSEGFMTKRVDSFIRLCNRRNALEQLRVCIEYNVLCKNPYETDISEIKMMTVREFCEAIGHSYSTVSRLLETYSKICFLVDSEVEQFCKFVSDGNDIDNAWIFVNPHVIYSGTDPEQVKVLGAFCQSP